MRIYLWHGYLLSGTGSNEYTRALARTLTGMGHDVTVFSQDPDPAGHDLGGAAVVRPALPGRLPVFVLDRYADSDPALLTDLPREDLDAFVSANAASIREQGPADLLICNHVLLGGPVGAATGLPYVVKAHGSELEYAMRGRGDLCAWARASLAGARAVMAGSEHIGRVLADLVGPDPDRVHVIPPGVDTDLMRPMPRDEALAGLVGQCQADAANPGDERLPDPGNADRLAAFLAEPRETVVYVGKLSTEKGVPLLVHAVRDLGLRTVIVGFGPARAELEPTVGPDVLFTGPLQHRHLRYLWPLADVSVVPSVFPEAFGMVAAEAAACGCPPLVARQTGLAEIAAGLERFAPPGLAPLFSFRSGDGAALSARLAEVTTLEPEQWTVLSQAARDAAVGLWSWGSVAGRILAL